MPKQTFFNLPEDKKERIINISIDEFARYYYHKASITRIVNSAGIAKGSFYQYFENKKDLFKYIVQKIGEKKLKYLAPILSNINNMDFFEVVRQLYIAAINFAMENPKLQSIGDSFTKDNDIKLKEEIIGSTKPKSNDIFISLIKKGIEKGEINPNIDIQLTASIITNLSVMINELFVKEMKKNDYMEIMPLVDNMLYILKNGIQGRE